MTPDNRPTPDEPIPVYVTQRYLDDLRFVARFTVWACAIGAVSLLVFGAVMIFIVGPPR